MFNIANRDIHAKTVLKCFSESLELFNHTENMEMRSLTSIPLCVVYAVNFDKFILCIHIVPWWYNCKREAKIVLNLYKIKVLI